MKAYCKYSDLSIWFALMMLLTGCEHYKPSPDTVSGLTNDPLKAVTAVKSTFQQVFPFPGRPCQPHFHSVSYMGKVKSWSVSGFQFQIICLNGTQATYRYRDTPVPEAIQQGMATFVVLRRIDGESGGWGEIGWGKGDFYLARDFVQAWFVLAQPRKLQDPAADAVFLDAVKRYRAEPQTHAEPLRRVQAQVEGALNEHRVLEAATLYYDALKSAQGWPEGHFNLAILYGDLEFYAEAINEMRRYLFLVPTAPDARAAQDKIYEWERKAK